MDPLTLGLLSQLPQFGLGLWQTISGAGAKVDRPQMPIPQSAKSALGLAQSGAGQANMAGYNQAMDNINRTLAATMGSAGQVATGSGQALEALVNAGAVGMQQKGNLDVMNAQDAERRREILRNELGHMAEWENQKWAWDFQKKFQEDAAAKSAKIGAGIQNMGGAIGGAGDMFMAKSLYDPATPPAVNPQAFGGGTMAVGNSPAWFGQGAMQGAYNTQPFMTGPQLPPLNFSWNF